MSLGYFQDPLITVDRRYFETLRQDQQVLRDDLLEKSNEISRLQSRNATQEQSWASHKAKLNKEIRSLKQENATLLKRNKELLNGSFNTEIKILQEELARLLRKPTGDTVPIDTVSSLYDLYNLKSKELENEKSERQKFQMRDLELETKINENEMIIRGLELTVNEVETEKKELYEKHVELSTKLKDLESKNVESENMIINATSQLVPAFKAILQLATVSRADPNEDETDNISKMKLELQEKGHFGHNTAKYIDYTTSRIY